MTPEERLQIDVVDFLRVAAPDLLFWHTANERKCSPQRGALLKRKGVMAGVPDLTFILPGGRVAFIELKAPKGRMSKAQDAFFGTATALDVPCFLAGSIKDVEVVLRRLGAPLRASVTA